MMPFSLFLALKYLKPKRSFISVVTVISIMGVMLGVAIMIIVQAVMTGFDNTWRDKILSFKPHITLTGAYGTIEDELAVCESIDAVPGVTGCAPVVETIVLAQHDGRSYAPYIIGIDPDRAGRISGVPTSMEAGGTFSLEGNQAVVGTDLAQTLRLHVGDRFLVYSPMSVTTTNEIYLPEELQVAGIFNMGMRDYDAMFILTSLDVARTLVGLESGAQSIYVKTSRPIECNTVAEAIRKTVGDGNVVRTWQVIDKLFFEALQYEKGMMFILMGFITLVAIFCVAVTVIVVSYQKTAEVGLLKSLGFSPLRILMAFLWFGWIQCVVGMLAGFGVAFAVLHNLGGIIAVLRDMGLSVFPKGIYGLETLPWDISRTELIGIAAIVFVFSTLSSILPALRAALLNPVEALRHE